MREIAAQHLRRDEPPVEQRGDPDAQPPLPELREHQRHVIVVSRDGAADAKRPIERFADEARHLGVVGQVERRVDVGFERKLAQQRQTEGVDRRDRDVAEPILEIAPADEVRRRQTARLAQAVDDPLAHLGGRLARERDREDVIGIDAGAQQIHVALDEHTRLARAGRRLEHDVARRDRRRDPAPSGRQDGAGTTPPRPRHWRGR